MDTTALRRMIAEEIPSLIELRHDLHRHPELGYEEHRTRQVVERELGSSGVKFMGGLAGGTGVLGFIPGKATDSVGLRADMDALPIVEETGLPYASTVPGKMHACGHDGHTTILVGAARVLSKIAKAQGLPRPVHFVFQPAEEGGAGAKRMVEDGCLTGKHFGAPVERMFGLHGWPDLPLGVVGTRPGPLLAASDRFDIHVKGVGSHAAWPHASRDPVVAAGAIIGAVQTIASRNVGPLESVVVSLTMLRAGSAFNVIPPDATISGTVRSLTPQVLALAQKRLKEIAEGVAQGYGCTATLDYRLGYPVTLNAPEAVETFNRTATEALGGERVVELANPVMGGEDFAHYCHKVPSCFFVLGLVPRGQTSMPSLHHPAFDFNDEAIATGIELFCRLALNPN